ncbi:MAG: LIC_13355 family lipoprotein [Deltaproteobacteria bacterium]|nr:LIC_13355 family lipoprotein [Deltaproteobacteria bacterium]
MRALVLGASLVLVGCGHEPLGHYADEIVEAPGATGVSYGDPTRAVNGVRGGGTHAGSLDVYSLDDRERTHLVLAFSARTITNTPGPDLVVFENGFQETSRDAFFMDPVIVEVSRDGARWLAFPHDYVAADETVYEPYPEAWDGFAGVTPVVVNVDRDPMDPLSPTAGGDAFDLDELTGETDDDRALAAEMKREGVRYVRLSSASRAINPDTGVAYPRDPVSDGADIDGVAARTLAPIDGSP